ncbi:DegV family protein [Coprobacillaceae bacterium CR2/5/TPMF4]|nr:DegV family protein [Coprobacillaceae bacterium CR2/5/TPMF4]
MYRIVTDGSCDLGTNLTKKLDVDVVPFYISLDGVNYQKK